MRVLLTGGTGNVGVAAVTRLVENGHDVTVIGRRAGMELEGAEYVQCDVTDYDALLGVTQGHDAVVHLAAIPSPWGHPGREVFHANDQGTFNVFEAAAEAGILRVVGASSINAFGYFFGDRSFPIDYLPVDEQLPGLATDAYSFSKQVMEDIARYFWERDQISSVMLRLPGVWSHDRIVDGPDDRHRYRPEIIEGILSMSGPEREAELARLGQAYDRFRREHRPDKMTPGMFKNWRNEEWKIDYITREEFRMMMQRANFFTYVDELDSAQAIEKGLTVEFDGSHSLYINSHRNSLGLPMAEVAKLYSPPVPEVRPQHEGDDSVMSIDRARELIGFEPEWSIPGALA